MTQLYSLNSNQAYIQQAKLALLKIQSELTRRQLSQTVSQQKQLPHRLSNAQYFVHELYYYLGFTPLEIVAHTKIKLVTIINLILETTRTLSKAKLQRLTYFYCAAVGQKVMPQCYLNTTNTQLTVSLCQELSDFITTSAEPGYRHLMRKLAHQEQIEICSQQQASND